MAPWNRLRSDRSGEKPGKKRTAPNSRPSSRSQSRSQSQLANEAPSSSSAPLNSPPETPNTPLSRRRTHRTRDSVVSLSAVQDPPKRSEDIPARVPLLELPESTPTTARPQRFSLLRFRHASDSHLSKTVQEHAASPPPPIPAPPSIITTAPTSDNLEVNKRRSTFSLARRSRAFPKHVKSVFDGHESPHPASSGKPSFEPESPSRPSFAPSEALTQDGEATNTLPLPDTRVSDSSRSDTGSIPPRQQQSTKLTQTVSSAAALFRNRTPRKKKTKDPLFPLPPKTNSNLSSLTNTPRVSSARSSESPVRRLFTEDEQSRQQSPAGGHIQRSESRGSSHSRKSRNRPPNLEQRGRSSTLSSLRKQVAEDDSMPTPPLPISTRTSTSTTGRPSLGGMFNVNRARQNDNLGPRGVRNGDPGTPISLDSKQNSFHLAREPVIVIPEREEGDSPAKYLARLEEALSKGALINVLSKSEDEFMKNVLRSYMRRFKFFEDPLDMAVRKMLMHVELPKETGQIDRTLQSFADRYHECNPGIFPSADDAYFVAFSVLILHTDAFNRNNKRKMSKFDYLKNAQSQGGISSEVLECFYDNTCYTTFIHLEDETHNFGERSATSKTTKKPPFKPGNASKRSQASLVDPYALILENKLDMLRPALDDVLVMEDNFNFLAPNSTLNISELNRSFFKSGVIQIISTRSRPEAFANQATVLNPAEASVGVVDIKVTKVGVIWRKDPKKKKTRSPWQEWGAILTGSQLYFFRNTSWVKNLMHQYEHFYKTHAQGPVIFKPPLEHFKPDFLVSLDDAVALVDSTYKKHKNAMLLTRQDSYSEVLLADNEVEYRDWLAKINFAATFRTAGIRMRGTLGQQDSRKSHDTHRAVSSASNDSTIRSDDQSRPSTLPGELTEEQQIVVARRQAMAQKIQESEARIRGIEKAIDVQLRNGRHLRILTPIQQRTREDVTLAAVHLAEAIRSMQIAKWRTRCYRKILALDLEDDLKIRHERGRSMDGDAKDVTPSTTRDSDKARLPFARLSSKGSTAGSQSVKTRPSTQPTSQKLFSMDEIFRTPSKLRSQSNKPKAAWELPPINFDRRKSTSQTRTSKKPDEQALEDTEGESLKTASIVREGVRRRSSELGPRPELMDQEERAILVQSGVDPNQLEHSPEKDKIKQASDDIENGKVLALDEREARAKARHSFQRKLQGGHVPTHQRSRKGKDSASTIVGSEETNSTAETEGLMRASGSFTVHGKKASVVTFGSEWQNISAEDRLRLRREQQDSEKPDALESIASENSPIDDIADPLSPVSLISGVIAAPSFKSAHSSLEQDSLSTNSSEELVSETLSPKTMAAPKAPREMVDALEHPSGDGVTETDASEVTESDAEPTAHHNGSGKEKHAGDSAERTASSKVGAGLHADVTQP